METISEQLTDIRIGADVRSGSVTSPTNRSRRSWSSDISDSCCSGELTQSLLFETLCLVNVLLGDGGDTAGRYFWALESSLGKDIVLKALRDVDRRFCSVKDMHRQARWQGGGGSQGFIQQSRDEDR